MGSAERRARHKEGLRQKILDAARAIIISEGFDSLTMRKIAAAIEYSPAALYLHFKDRDEIARELSREGYGELFASLAPAARIANPLDRLKAIGKAYVEFGVNHPETYRLIFMEYKYLAAVFSDHGTPAEDDPGTSSFQLLVHTAEELKADGSIAVAATPLQIAETFWAGVHGIVSLKLTCPVFPMSTAHELEAIMTDALLKGMQQGVLAAAGSFPAKAG